MERTPGRAFYQRQIVALEAGDLNALNPLISNPAEE
jgi:hypothetical protein